MGTEWAREGDDGRGADLGLGGANLLGRLAAWAAEARVDEAAAARSRERWLRQVAGEEASFAGVLIDLAERGSPVVAAGVGGRRHRGVVVAVGSDFVALRTPVGRDVLLAVTAIGALRPEGGADASAGDRVVTVELDLAGALATLVPDRPRLLLVPRSGDDGVAGTLRAVGRDVVVLRTDGSPAATVYVPVGAIAEVSTA